MNSDDLSGFAALEAVIVPPEVPPASSVPPAAEGQTEAAPAAAEVGSGIDISI